MSPKKILFYIDIIHYLNIAEMLFSNSPGLMPGKLSVAPASTMVRQRLHRAATEYFCPTGVSPRITLGQQGHQRQPGMDRDRAGIVRDRAGIARDKAGIARDRAGIARDRAVIARDRAGIARVMWHNW